MDHLIGHSGVPKYTRQELSSFLRHSFYFLYFHILEYSRSSPGYSACWRHSVSQNLEKNFKFWFNNFSFRLQILRRLFCGALRISNAAIRWWMTLKTWRWRTMGQGIRYPFQKFCSQSWAKVARDVCSTIELMLAPRHTRQRRML